MKCVSQIPRSVAPLPVSGDEILEHITEILEIEGVSECVRFYHPSISSISSSNTDNSRMHRSSKLNFQLQCDNVTESGRLWNMARQCFGK